MIRDTLLVIQSKLGRDDVLILRRKVGEGILINEKIVVRVLSVEHGDVKIGIEAPKNFKILREELYKEVIKVNRESKDFDITRVKGIIGKGKKDGDHK